MLSDIEIAQSVTPRPIAAVAEDKLGIGADHLEPYGHDKAKLSLDFIRGLKDRPDGKLILVTAMSPTPAGEGKTTTTVGLGDALNLLGHKAMITLREPSLGPCFGIKGGAAGGGWAQVIPMEDINLHFTGDFHAVGLAHNLLTALVDNHMHHGNALGIDVRRVSWRRVIDMNDRALRHIVAGIGGPMDGVPRTDGFDIVVASEVMAILCLATSIKDMRERLGNIVVGYTTQRQPVMASELNAHGAMSVLLKDAIKPNLVQTLEGNPALIHGGPFANFAHGCNTVIATKTALKLADYVVTEAGFGADLGAEKFIDIKCRKAGLTPAAAVVVATVRALKFHGGVDRKELAGENVSAVRKGLANLERHVRNVHSQYGLPCVVALNRFTADSASEIDVVMARMRDLGVRVVIADHWEKGGAGAIDLAREVIDLIANEPAEFRFVYNDNTSIWGKIAAVATSVYGAREIIADKKVRKQIKDLQEQGYGRFPVCIAKTQYSFSTDPLLLGAPDDHVVPIREIRLNAGAEFIVVVCGDIMTMPGLPKKPAAERIDIDAAGKVSGLF